MSRTLHTPSNYSNGLTGNMNARYAMTRQQVADLATELNTPSFIDNIAKLFSTPIENIISLYRFPFDIKQLTPSWSVAGETPIVINIIAMSTAKGLFLNPVTPPILDIGSATVSRYFNSFLDFAPYTKVELYLPYIGFVTLDTSVVMGETIHIKYVVDFFTGACTAFVTVGNGDEETIILTQDGKIGMQIQIAGGSGADISRSLLKFGLSTAGSLATATAGNAPALTASTLSGAVSAGQIHVHKNGTTEANSAFYAPQNAFLVYTRPVISRPSSYNSLKGRPSNKTKILSQLSGYTVVDAIHMDTTAGATADELNEIENLLKSGVIL